MRTYNSSDSVKNQFWAQRIDTGFKKTPTKNKKQKQAIRVTFPRVVWAEESKTGLVFEIGPRQQKL